MLWNKFEFELKHNNAYEGGISVWISNIMSGHIIAITSKGLHRETGLNPSSGFVLDSEDSGYRVRFLRGEAKVFPLSSAPISAIDFDFGCGNRQWSLWKNPDVDAVTVRFTLGAGLYKRALLLTPTGIYRYVSCYMTKLPVDKDGRLQVLR